VVREVMTRHGVRESAANQSRDKAEGKPVIHSVLQ
jgi:hypothetical protein